MLSISIIDKFQRATDNKEFSFMRTDELKNLATNLQLYYLGCFPEETARKRCCQDWIEFCTKSLKKISRGGYSRIIFPRLWSMRTIMRAITLLTLFGLGFFWSSWAGGGFKSPPFINPKVLMRLT